MPQPATALRMTPQRRAVLDVLDAATDHPTAAEVLERVQRIMPGVGAATVYRTLGMLVAAGRARELSLGEGTSARFDGNPDRHDHVVCDRCGRAVDLDQPVPAAVLDAVAGSTGFRLTGYDLQFHGVCPRCAGAATPTVPTRTTQPWTTTPSPTTNPSPTTEEEPTWLR